MDKNGLLYKYLSGVCADVSMDSCLVQLTDFVFKGINKDIHTDIADTQKGFDQLDHDELQYKLYKIGNFTDCNSFKKTVCMAFQI